MIKNKIKFIFKFKIIKNKIKIKNWRRIQCYNNILEMAEILLKCCKIQIYLSIHGVTSDF
jgi:hypothetical protein